MVDMMAKLVGTCQKAFDLQTCEWTVFVELGQSLHTAAWAEHAFADHFGTCAADGGQQVRAQNMLTEAPDAACLNTWPGA